MMKWHAVELHTHTYHSDGDFTLDELVETVQSLDFSAVCLTDHNTFSGYDEFEKALQKYQFIGVKGIEWTTYFGHLLVLGEEGKCDWRQSKKNNLDASLRAIHESGGISGIAHPYALSTPINTGYDFQFNIEDYSLVDFIEVWSRDFPEGKVRTIRAFKLWEEKLNQGYKITGTSGRDYHRADVIPVSYGNTYIGIDIQQILDSTQIVKAIKKGRIVVTLGPLLTAQIEKNDQVYEVGDVINRGRSLIKIQIDSKKNIGKWQIFDIKPKEIKFIHNGKIIYETNYEEEHEVLLNLEKGWLRVDLIGEYLGVENSRLAFTNPFYIE